MRKIIFNALLIVCLLTTTSHAADEKKVNSTNTFTSSTAGFSITKPPAWFFGTMEQVTASRASIRLKDEELGQQVREANSPLVVILKHKEPYEGLNPSVQVLLRPLGQLEGEPAVEVMNIIIPTVKRAMPDFTIVEPIKETTVNGRKAAYMKSKYTVKNAEGGEFPVLSRLWVIPRGNLVFMVSMLSPQEGPDVSETEFAEVLRSIRIEK